MISEASSNKQNSHGGFTVAKQTALYQQHLDKTFCDVIIKIRDEEFYIHSCIVAATCPKLQKLIEEKKKLSDTSPLRCPYVVDFDDTIFTPKVFEFILSYLYLGVLEWNKVAPGLVNQILDAANWCEFNQLIEDYMSMSQEEENNDGVEGSTIVMVDTCLDSDDSFEKQFDQVEEGGGDEKEEEETENDVAIDQEGLYCIVCNAQFNLDQEEELAEHLRAHEVESPEVGTPSRRGVARRKASLAVKSKYESLIPTSKSSKDVKIKKEPIRRTPKKKGQITLFKKEFTCDHCNKNLASQKALTSHMRHQCPWRDQPEVQLDPLSTEELATHLLSELATESETTSSLPTTKGFTIQTGSYVRTYSKKRNRSGRLGLGDDKKAKTAKLWICPRCPDLFFENKRDQLFHIRSMHGAIKRHVCEHCGKSLVCRTALELHMRIHTGERPFVCPTCGRGFTEKKTMEGHTRRHTGERPFLCTVCGKDFGYRQSLYRHMKFHGGERPYQCQVCSKTFVLRQNLQEHVVRHNKHQLIKCEQCNHQFANKDLLLKHQLEAHVIKNGAVSEEMVEMRHGNLNILDMSAQSGESHTVASYEVTIDNTMLGALTQ